MLQTDYISKLYSSRVARGRALEPGVGSTDVRRSGGGSGTRETGPPSRDTCQRVHTRLTRQHQGYAATFARQRAQLGENDSVSLGVVAPDPRAEPRAARTRAPPVADRAWLPSTRGTKSGPLPSRRSGTRPGCLSLPMGRGSASRRRREGKQRCARSRSGRIDGSRQAWG